MFARHSEGRLGLVKLVGNPLQPPVVGEGVQHQHSCGVARERLGGDERVDHREGLFGVEPPPSGTRNASATVASGQGGQCAHGVVSPFDRDEHVILGVARDDVGADAAVVRTWLTAAVRPTASRAERTCRVIQAATNSYGRPSCSASCWARTRVIPSSSRTTTTGTTPAGRPVRTCVQGAEALDDPAAPGAPVSLGLLDEVHVVRRRVRPASKTVPRGRDVQGRR